MIGYREKDLRLANGAALTEFLCAIGGWLDNSGISLLLADDSEELGGSADKGKYRYEYVTHLPSFVMKYKGVEESPFFNHPSR